MRLNGQFVAFNHLPGKITKSPTPIWHSNAVLENSRSVSEIGASWMYTAAAGESSLLFVDNKIGIYHIYQQESGISYCLVEFRESHLDAEQPQRV